MPVVKTIKRGELARHTYVPPDGSTGQVLTKSSDDDADLQWADVSAAAVSDIALNDLTDVEASAPANNQIISFDASASAWVLSSASVAVVAGVSALDDLSDVTITGPANGEVLRHNGTLWVNATLPRQFGYFELSATNRVIGEDAGGSNTGDNVFIGMDGAGENNEADDVVIIGLSAAPNLGANLAQNQGTIAIGTRTLQLTDNDISTVGPNLAIGYQAMRACDGNFVRNNVVVGYNALAGDLSADNPQGNTIVGIEAGERASGNSVTNTTLVGYRAGRAAAAAGSTPNGCTFIGANCGEAVTSPQNCTGVGNGALTGLTLGQNNVAIGNDAGDNIIGGDRNTIVGSLTNGWEGNDYTVVGQGAGQATGGDGTILIGTGSGRNGGSALGDSNLILGTNAGNLGLGGAVTSKFVVSNHLGGSTQDAYYLYGEIDNANLLLSNAPNSGVPSTAVPTGRDFNSAAGVFSQMDGTAPTANPDSGFVQLWWNDTDEHYRIAYNALGASVAARLVKALDSEIVMPGDPTVRIISGTGTPEAAVSAAVGSIFLRTSASGAALYVKEQDGTANTGWVLK